MNMKVEGSPPCLTASIVAYWWGRVHTDCVDTCFFGGRGGHSVAIIEPLTSALRDPAPPLPTGSLEAEAVPNATRGQPLPLVRILMPLIMVVVMLAMVAMMGSCLEGAPIRL